MNWLTNNLEKQLDRWISQWFNKTNTGDLIVVMLTTMMGLKPYAFIWNLGPWTQKMSSYVIWVQNSKSIWTFVESQPRAGKQYEVIWNRWPERNMHSYEIWAQGFKTIWIHMESKPMVKKTYLFILSRCQELQNHMKFTWVILINLLLNPCIFCFCMGGISTEFGLVRSGTIWIPSIRPII